MIGAVDWDLFLPAADLGDVQHFVVKETTALQDGAALLDTEPVDAWKKYLAFHVASDNASTCRRRSTSELRLLSQATEWPAKCSATVGSAASGCSTPCSAKASASSTSRSFSRRTARRRWTRSSPIFARPWPSDLQTLTWMDDATQDAALRRSSSTFEPHVGYPAQWRDYSASTSSRASCSRTSAARESSNGTAQLARLNNRSIATNGT